jgi:AraC-like DNA-binding protein
VGSATAETGTHTSLELVRESAASRPAAALRPYVAWYIGYRQAGPPGQHRGLPSPYLTLIFTLDDPIVVAGPAGLRPGRYQTLAGGLHTQPALITHPGRQSGVQLMVTPLGTRTLLGLPAGELAGLDVEASALLGPLAGEVQDRLRHAPDWPSRFAVLNQLLTARIQRPEPGAGAAVSPGARWAWRELLATHGGVSVGELASETGWSSRNLRQVFRREIGLGPKAAARVIRFDRTRRLLQREAATGQPRPLAELAVTCGYYDQAHLAREFNELAGCPPSAWLADEGENLQGSGSLRIAGAGH